MEVSIIPSEKIESLLADMAEVKALLHERNHQADLNKWHSKQEARNKLHVCMKTLDSYLAKGTIPYSRFAGKIYIKASDIEAHLQRNYISR
jgi:hypothetical protein